MKLCFSIICAFVFLYIICAVGHTRRRRIHSCERPSLNGVRAAQGAAALDAARLVRVHEDFRVIALGVPVHPLTPSLFARPS